MHNEASELTARRWVAKEEKVKHKANSSAADLLIGVTVKQLGTKSVHCFRDPPAAWWLIPWTRMSLCHSGNSINSYRKQQEYSGWLIRVLLSVRAHQVEHYLVFCLPSRAWLTAFHEHLSAQESDSHHGDASYNSFPLLGMMERHLSCGDCSLCTVQGFHNSISFYDSCE